MKPTITSTPQCRLVIRNGLLILPDKVIENGCIAIRDGIIETVGMQTRKRGIADQVIDAQGRYVSPGFVDLHVHGGDGADFMDGTPEAVRTACRCHLRHGTTTIFPTTTTGSPEQLTAMLSSCAEVQTTWSPIDGSKIAGVHFYGPYFARDKVGCHNPAGQRSPNVEEYKRHFSIPNADRVLASHKRTRAQSLIRIATCAAELPGAVEFYKFARRQGCLLTCGHSNASWQEMARGFEAGLRHVDHFWCAMSSVPSLLDRLGTPMQASMEQFVLSNPEMSTEVLADGCHLSPQLIEFAYSIKGADRLCLVTDASRAVDMPVGRYRFGPASDGEWFVSDGSVGRMPDTGTLASSVAGMDRMVRTTVAATSIPLHAAVRMASLTPAERAGVADQVGSLEPGKRGDVLILSKRLKIKNIVVASPENVEPRRV